MTRSKRDANHAEIKAAFEHLGWSVMDTADLRHGRPDMVVGKGTRCLLVEVKAPGGTYTDDEVEFALAWRGPYVTVRTLDDVVRIING